MKTSKRKVHHEHEKTTKHEAVSKEDKVPEKAVSQGKNWHGDPGKSYLVLSVTIMVVLLGVIIYLLSKNGPAGGSSMTSDYEGKKVKVEFYVMSQCPYGTQVEEAITPVLQKLGGAVDFQVDYIVRESNPGTFEALHGPKEVAGNIVQLCVDKHYPDKFVDFVSCQNKDAANVDTNWQSCGNSLGMDTAKLGTCLNSDEGKTLLRESMQKTNARGASGSPTMFINDQPYNGGRTTADFQKAICQHVDHPECANIPKCSADTDCTAEVGKEGTCLNPGQKDASCTYSDPMPVDYVVLTEETCSSCDTTQIVSVSQQLFMGGKPRVVDIDTAEGKSLISKYGITVVPAYIFDASVAQTKSWTQIPDLGTAFQQLSDGKYRLKDEVTGSTYFVSETARAEFEAAQAKLAEEKLAMIGATKGDNKPQIDFFVMSYCPFGNQAEEGIAPVYELLKDKVDFKPHYVIYPNYGGGGSDFCIGNGELCSMHGIVELNQDVREACVYKQSGQGKWFDFALAMNKQCNSQNADTCWEGVATGLGLDVAKIKTCQANEAETLMRADKTLGDLLGVQGSPTVFIDGMPYDGGRSPEAYKTALCAAFENAPAECLTKLAGEATTNSAPAAGCGV